jgi:hypothetical protein
MQQVFLQAQGMMNNQGVCCHAGFIDECGVCGGKGDSCGDTVNFKIAIPSIPVPGRRLSASVLEQIELDVKATVVRALGYPQNLVTVLATEDGAGNADVCPHPTCGQALSPSRYTQLLHA